MKRWLQCLWVLTVAAFVVSAVEVELDEQEENRQRCSGMYSRKAWGGSVDPFILTKFMKPVSSDTSDPVVSLVVFEWGDEELIGRYADESAIEKDYICDSEAVASNECTDEEIGAFILSANATEKSKSRIISKAIHLNDPPAINYPILKTGYYCVMTYAYSSDEYEAIVEFRNAYGELPAAQIPKLPFYGGLTIVYGVIGVFWAFLYVQHRHDILPVQNYITAIIIFLIVEQLMTWGFYDYQNRHGTNALSKFLMLIVAILNAGRNSFSFFLLLIVCMGFGVVKASLGRTMVYVRWLALAHFTFGVIYAVASLTVTPDSAGPLVLLVILPLAGTLTAFYVWTLNSLNLTLRDLIQRKQHVKAMMYKKLWWCILGSIIIIFAFFFINSLLFAGHSSIDFVPEHWRTRWFILDGWLNIVYLFDIAYIAYLWRPTANNKRFAMSDEIAQDDDGFEIASFANSLSDEEDVRSVRDQPTPADSTSSPPSQKNANAEPIHKAEGSDRGQTKQRESMDGETIFAVGEGEDKWDDSDEEAQESERAKLTGGH